MLPATYHKPGSRKNRADGIRPGQKRLQQRCQNDETRRQRSEKATTNESHTQIGNGQVLVFSESTVGAGVKSRYCCTDIAKESLNKKGHNAGTKTVELMQTGTCAAATSSLERMGDVIKSQDPKKGENIKMRRSAVVENGLYASVFVCMYVCTVYVCVLCVCARFVNT